MDFSHPILAYLTVIFLLLIKATAFLVFGLMKNSQFL